MQTSTTTLITRRAIAAAVVLTIFVVDVATAVGDVAPLVYDLEWNGPETSFAEECLLEGSCYRYPIQGTIGVILDPVRPSLLNINSSIVTPFGAPPSTCLATPGLDNWRVPERSSEKRSVDAILS